MPCRKTNRRRSGDVSATNHSDWCKSSSNYERSGKTVDTTMPPFSKSAFSVSVASIHGQRCVGDASGAITLAVVGGRAPQTYLWSNGATTSSLSGVAAGTYSVVVTDNNAYVYAVRRRTDRVANACSNVSICRCTASPVPSSIVVPFLNANSGVCDDGNAGKQRYIVLSTGHTRFVFQQ